MPKKLYGIFQGHNLPIDEIQYGKGYRNAKSLELFKRFP